MFTALVFAAPLFAALLFAELAHTVIAVLLFDTGLADVGGPVGDSTFAGPALANR